MKASVLRNCKRKTIIFVILGLTFVKVNAQDIITTYGGTGTASFAGDGNVPTSANFRNPSDVFIDASGNMYIADGGNHCIRKVDAVTGLVTTIAGTGGTSGSSGDGGLATSARLNTPGTVCTDASGNVYIGDFSNHRIRKVDAVTGIISTFAGTGTAGYTGDGGAATSANLNGPYGLAFDSNGDLFFSDNTNHVIRKITLSTGIISTYAGTGTAGSSGDGGAATSARLNYPRDICFDASDNLYIADRINNKVRKVNASTGIITTYAGTGTPGSTGDGGVATSARLRSPFGVSIDALGHLYIADATNNKIRVVDSGTGIISTFGGTGTAGFSGDGGDATLANLNFPEAVFADVDYLYVADHGNNRIRRIQYENVVLASELLEFQVVYSERKAISEVFISGEVGSKIALERSKDGGNWEELQNWDLQPKVTHFLFEDLEPFAQVSYYRIVEYQLTGKTECRGIRMLVRPENNICMYPNPLMEGDLTIQIPTFNEELEMVCYDTNGSCFYRKKIAQNQMQFIDSETFTKGVCFVLIYEKDKIIFSEQLIVQ